MRLPQNAGSVPLLRMMRVSSWVSPLACSWIWAWVSGVMLCPVAEYMGLGVSGLGCSGAAGHVVVMNDSPAMMMVASALWISIWFSPAGMIAE